MYVYLLQSKNYPTQRYIGSTKNIKQRLQEHNHGKSIHTSKFRPWKVIACTWLENEEKAAAFEKYLKHGSGHAFANKHFW